MILQRQGVNHGQPDNTGAIRPGLRLPGPNNPASIVLRNLLGDNAWAALVARIQTTRDVPGLYIPDGSRSGGKKKKIKKRTEKRKKRKIKYTKKSK